MKAAIVVKFGGETIESPLLDSIADDLAYFVQKGMRVLVVHGGGPQVSSMSRRLGIEPVLLGGRRVTDERTLDVVKMTLAGQVNVALCSRLQAKQVKAIGLHDAVHAHRRPPRVITGAGSDPIDLGLVGDVDGFDRALLDSLTAASYVPVLASLGKSRSGEVFNINADVVAARLAGEYQAQALFSVTTTDGVLGDVKDSSSRFSQLTAVQAKAAIADGSVGGGMIPKLEEALLALELGAQAVYIVRDKLRAAFEQPGSTGTQIIKT